MQQGLFVGKLVICFFFTVRPLTGLADPAAPQHTPQGSPAAEQTASWQVSVSAPIPVLGRDIPILVRTENNETWLSPRNGLSLVAILLSICSLGFTEYTRRRNRKQSVNDEFWLRKVAYPLVIEPIATMFTQTVRDLPLESRTANSSVTQSINEFCTSFLDELEQKRGTLMLLAVAIDPDKAQEFHSATTAALDDLEDTVSNYCHEQEAALASGFRPKLGRDATIQKTQIAFARFLKPIRDLQHSA